MALTSFTTQLFVPGILRDVHTTYQLPMLYDIAIPDSVYMAMPMDMRCYVPICHLLLSTIDPHHLSSIKQTKSPNNKDSTQNVIQSQA